MGEWDNEYGRRWTVMTSFSSARNSYFLRMISIHKKSQVAWFLVIIVTAAYN